MIQRKRVPGRTFDKILKTAQKHFAAKGFDGTRVDEIARDAKVNKAMIYYHFKNKKDLYRSVFLSLAPFSEMQANVDEVAGRDIPPKEMLGFFMSRFFEILNRNSEFMRMVQWELASGPHFMPMFIQDFALPIVIRFMAIIEMGIERGIFRRIDPFLTYYHVLGLIMSYFYFRPIREALADRLKGIDISGKFEPEYFKKHFMELVFDGIIKDDDEDNTGK